MVRVVVLPERSGVGRLGRHVEHDERSRSYRVTPSLVVRSVRWSRRVPPYDQGDLGSCTGNAMAGLLSTKPWRHWFTEHRAVKLYEAATRLDSIQGSYPPDDTGSSGLAVMKAAQQAGYITGYRHCFGLQDVLHALQSGPVITGVNWYEGMDTPDQDGLVHVAGGVRGGHEFELVGVDVDRQRILAVNSWGRGWGAGGYFELTFADYERLLAEDGDATQPA